MQDAAGEVYDCTYKTGEVKKAQDHMLEPKHFTYSQEAFVVDYRSQWLLRNSRRTNNK